MRCLRALPLAALLSVTAATPLFAQESWLDRSGIWSSVLTDFPAWIAAPGRPGFTPNADRATTFPHVRGGLTMGAWAIDNAARSDLEMPWPGLAGITPALAWDDSVAFGPTTPSEATDMSPPLAGGTSHELSSGGARTHAVVGSMLDGFDAREPVVWVARGDSSRRASIALLSGARDGTGAYGPSGRHLWSTDVMLRFGAHRVAGAYLQRAQAMELVSGERGSGSGATGYVDYRFLRPTWRLTARGERGWDYQESVIAVPDPLDSTLAFLEPSRRDAQENRVSGTLDWARRGRAVSLRGQWSDAEVRRDRSPAFETRGRLWELALATRAALGEGTLDLALGAANQDVVGRTVWMPSLSYRVRTDAFDGGVSAARLTVPVWSDLAEGQTPFLQDTWVGGIDAGTALGGHARARLGAQLGRTSDRAILFRLPIEEMWLRNGAVADPERWTFGLYTMSAAWEGARAAVRGEGFVLARDAHAIQPRVDPAHGARAEAEWGFTSFQSDLLVTFRLDGALVGPRESESVSPRRLDGYVTSGASAIVTLGDAMVVLRMNNLENQRHEEAWIDLATGREALGPAREMRLSVMVRLSD